MHIENLKWKIVLDEKDIESLRRGIAIFVTFPDWDFPVKISNPQFELTGYFPSLLDGS